MRRKVLGLTGDIPILKKIRYCLGSAGDELPYALFYTYFMMYLTEVAGINAVVAGIISAIAAACDGLIDPALGNFSDNLNRRLGTRQKGMIMGLGPLAIVTILLFVPAPFTGVGMYIYYAIFSIMFVSFYSLYSMNFVAMGAEMTGSYEERNLLRMICGLMAPFFAWCGHGGPQLVQVIFDGMDLKQQWFSTGFSITLIYVACCTICIFVALSPKKVKELKDKGEFHQIIEEDIVDDSSAGGFWKNLKEVLKVKALRAEIIMVLGFSTANGFFYALIAYVLTYSMDLSAGQQALFWAIEGVIYYVAVVICVPLANIFGKKPVFIICYGMAGIIITLFFFLPITNMIAAIAIMAAFTCIEAPFWTLYCTWGYEISDIDEFASGKRRTTLILSVASVFIKVGPTLSYIFTGIILNSIGYVEGGVSQTASVATGLHTYITILPGLFLLLGLLGAILYPVTLKSYESLKKNMEARKANKEYDTEGFEFLLPSYYKEKK